MARPYRPKQLLLAKQFVTYHTAILLCSHNAKSTG